MSYYFLSFTFFIINTNTYYIKYLFLILSYTEKAYVFHSKSNHTEGFLWIFVYLNILLPS